MEKMLIVVPSRGRPQNAKRLFESWNENECREARLVFCIDEDDPTGIQYRATGASVEVGPRKRIGPILNEKITAVANDYEIIGFMGDDHLPRTKHWDSIIIEKLEEMKTGIVYGNDLLQGAIIPTAVFITTNIIRSLGYFCPPTLEHMYLDNAWKDWGEGAQCLHYFPDVIIEHMHPGVGKAEGDVTYQESNALMGPDQDRYKVYQQTQMATDIAAIKALMA